MDGGVGHTAWAPEGHKGLSQAVQRAQSRPEGPPAWSRAMEGPLTSSFKYLI